MVTQSTLIALYMNEINRWPSGNIAYNGGLDTTLGQWDFSTSFEFIGGVIESLPEPSLTEGEVPARYKHDPGNAFSGLSAPSPTTCRQVHRIRQCEDCVCLREPALEV